MGRHLPGWVFEREAPEMTVYRAPVENGRTRPPMNAQTGLFAEAIDVDGGEATLPDALLDYRFEPGGLAYLLFPAPDVYVEKHVCDVEGGLAVRYAVDNRDEVAHRVRLRTTHELSPDYAESLGRDKSVFSYALYGGRFPAVRNEATGTTLVLEPSLEWDDARCVRNLLACEVRLTFVLDVPPRSQAGLEIRLIRHHGVPASPPGAALKG
jgi:hypothetical protein